MSTYYNSDFGDMTRADVSGIYAKRGEAAERRIFYFLEDSEDPTDKTPQIPHCHECNFTPDYVDCHYEGGGSIRFVRKD